jgi:hypothetical protein
MEYFASVLLGIFTKLFDDSIDLKLNISIWYIVFFQIMIIVLSIFIIKDDIILGVITVICLIISNYSKKFDHIFWYIYLFITFLVCIYYKNDIFDLFSNDLIDSKILFIILSCISICLEDYYYIEEKSKYKLKMRISNIIFNSLLIIYLQYYNYTGNDFVIKILIYTNAYFLTNIIIQYDLFNYLKKNTTTTTTTTITPETTDIVIEQDNTPLPPQIN